MTNLNNYADFYFNNGDYPDNTILSEDDKNRLATAFHEEQFVPKVGENFYEGAEAMARNYLSHAGLSNLDDATFQKGDGLTMDLMSGGQKLATYGLEVYIDEDAADELLPNGDKMSQLQEYGWDEFQTLAESEDIDFDAAVASISEDDGQTL